MTKNQRAKLHAMFGGRCAYCGCELPARWHADHFEPVMRTSKLVRHSGQEFWRYKRKAGPMSSPERDTFANMMPSCPRCNLDKGSFTIEQWRNFIVGHVTALRARHVPYNIAKAFGLITETGATVKFHFELAAQQGEPKA